LIHVIRCFENAAVEHPEGSVDPLRDLEILELELIFRDLAVVENRLGKLSSKKKLLPEETSEKALLERCIARLTDEKPIRGMEMTPEETRFLRGFAFVTSKPQIIALNMDESKSGVSDLPNGDALLRSIEERGLSAIGIYGRLEMDLLELSPEEAVEFTEGLSIAEPARDRLISKAYGTLGLISFFTCGPDEVRAWTLRDGETAVDAAGAIHSDLARGFIRAVVVSYGDYSANGDSLANCRDAGVLRQEGKDYNVKDGDIIEIRFNV
ncbi:MAG: DUF933 domain-containing protein, partial [Synergistaceae bacterium]|nr:DUF933 domain-containing protein [Synergistaceae bacterium]